jgi:hypothetical protein
MENEIKDEPTVDLKLTIAEVNAALSALGELPAKTSMFLIQKIKDQAIPQVAALGLLVEEQDDKDV